MAEGPQESQTSEFSYSEVWLVLLIGRSYTLLREAGFGVRFEYGEYQFAESGESDRLIIIEAVKRDRIEV